MSISGTESVIALPDEKTEELEQDSMHGLFECSIDVLANIDQVSSVKPHVDFGLKVLGANAMSIPGLYGFVQEMIKDQVANMYLWLKSLEVQSMDPTK
ncbi:synaptotagmin-2-like isoform X2 [Humulus lupulus]|uniref:synaptotagmin-2-like isoform X1 n=1 Tax=Humulus lupulus TaxID=3486 RepID=UPI002B403CA4|nr:synaptotagmin-2-like isoform X1 [Humulus lupulus]XP_062108491.1 synaptotagmin-2-like isoform X2 [Humulus lupulus]